MTEYYVAYFINGGINCLEKAARNLVELFEYHGIAAKLYENHLYSTKLQPRILVVTEHITIKIVNDIEHLEPDAYDDMFNFESRRFGFDSDRIRYYLKNKEKPLFIGSLVDYVLEREGM